MGVFTPSPLQLPCKMRCTAQDVLLRQENSSHRSCVVELLRLRYFRLESVLSVPTWGLPLVVPELSRTCTPLSSSPHHLLFSTHKDTVGVLKEFIPFLSISFL